MSPRFPARLHLAANGSPLDDPAERVLAVLEAPQRESTTPDPKEYGV